MGLLPIIDVLGKIVDNVIPDPDKKLEVKVELAKLADAEAAREAQLMIAQTEVNKVEAGHRSIFVAGWRPYIGWVGGAGLTMIYVVQPLVQLAHGQPVTIDTNELMVLLAGMLGFGVQRSFDKLKGTSNDVLPVFKEQVEPPKKGGILKKIGRGEWPF
jgi:hypothetical protein